MDQTLIFNCTHGSEDPERATLPFIGATIAAVSGQRSIVVCTIEAVRLGTHAGSEGIQAEGHEPLSTHISQFLAAGGELWLCSACTEPRGIGGSDCIEGASIVGAAAVVELLTAGARAISFG
ncbi:MAG: DsrE family protein [Actinomycetota bacterium]